MTNQEIFDKVLAHCRAQGMAAIDTSTQKCMYRAPGGLKCAVGCLIPDNVYSEDIEGSGMLDPTDVLRKVLTLSGLHEGQWPLLSQLQGAHDKRMPNEVGGDMGRFESGMRFIAGERGLVYKEKTQ